jgi:hypothetical protein
VRESEATNAVYQTGHGWHKYGVVLSDILWAGRASQVASQADRIAGALAEICMFSLANCGLQLVVVTDLEAVSQWCHGSPP